MTKSQQRRPVRRPRFGAAVLVLALVAAACTSGDAETTSSSALVVPDGSASAPSTTQAATSSAPAQTTAPIEVDPQVALADALAALQAGYQFSSETKVNGETAVTVEGRWLAGNSEMTIASGDGAIDYLFVGDQQFVLTPNGDWVELEATGPSADPLAALAGPLAMQVVDASPDRVVLAATYPGSLFELDVLEVDVALLVTGGKLTEASYVVEADGNIAESRTVFEQLTDQSPITAPAA